MNIKNYNTILKIIIFILLVTDSKTLAQTKIDTTYIKTYPQKMMIRGFVGINSIEIEDYSPNYPLNIGLGFALKNTIFDIKIGYGIVPLKSDEFGKSKVLDLQVHRYGRNFVLDVFVQRYKSFYQDNSKGEVTGLYPDLSITQIGAEGTYLIKGNKFSAKAAFNQNEIQLQSAGSWVLGSGIYYYKLNGFPTLKDSNSVENIQLGFNGGYGYSWVLDTYWKFSGMATLGTNFGKEINNFEKERLKMYPAAFTRMAVSYHKKDWSVCFCMLIQNKVIFAPQNNTIELASYGMQLSFVKHLDTFFLNNKIYS